MMQIIGGIESGQVVLVTAGASGIGRCIAENFLTHGCQVHVCDRDRECLDAFLADNAAAAGTLADISDPVQVENLFADIARRHGRLDTLVNNAGIAGPLASVEDITLEEWQRTIDVNLSGQFYVTRRAVPLLKTAGRGSIVNISSNAGLFGCPQRSPYSASKWALIGLTRTWAMELGPYNIRVNALCPGSVIGPRIDQVISRDARRRGLRPEQVREAYRRQNSMRLFAQAQDVADMVLFLSSSMGASVSGQSIGIDGHTESLSHGPELAPIPIREE